MQTNTNWWTRFSQKYNRHNLLAGFATGVAFVFGGIAAFCLAIQYTKEVSLEEQNISPTLWLIVIGPSWATVFGGAAGAWLAYKKVSIWRRLVVFIAIAAVFGVVYYFLQ